jgi:hypothetical protein
MPARRAAPGGQATAAEAAVEVFLALVGGAIVLGTVGETGHRPAGLHIQQDLPLAGPRRPAVLASYLGWRLEHAGYYMVTGETSTARVLVSGEATVISGVTVGVYLFRKTRLGAPAG